MEIMDLKSLLSIYKGKKVLVTGHTGFKGSWLTIWLLNLGANVVGYSLDETDKKNNFELSKISGRIKDIRGDIRNKEKLMQLFKTERPEIVFHLAAQALVIDGYSDPIYTYETNIMGTANVLEAIRLSDSARTAILITTDKVYENKEWIWPYREDEPMGGYDPYSSSKGAAELVIASYRNSYFNPNNYPVHKKSITSVRAGNVIGGGDWNKNRIVPDCIKSIENNEVIEVRNPKATRPWQHVLDPLGAYLLLGSKMIEEPTKYAEAWNFGPDNENIIDVESLVKKIIKLYKKGKWKDKSDPNALHEAKFLALDINKAKYKLNWQPVLNFEDTVKFTIDWYKNYKNEEVFDLCSKQIEKYFSLFEINFDKKN